MSEKMLPCPFCGGEKIGIGIISGDKEHAFYHYGVCEKCLTKGPLCSAENVAFMAWNALPRALRWTKEPPTKPGWYWHRIPAADCVIIEYVTGERHLQIGEYAGPIPEPKEK